MRPSLKPLTRMTARSLRASGDMMRRLTLNNSTLLASLFTMTAVACNSLVGLDDFSVSDGANAGSDAATNAGAQTTTGGSNGSAGGKGGGGSEQTGVGGNVTEAGAGGDGHVFVGECMTNQECVDKASQNPVETGGAGGEANGQVAAVCLQPEGRCQPLLSE